MFTGKCTVLSAALAAVALLACSQEAAIEYWGTVNAYQQGDTASVWTFFPMTQTVSSPAAESGGCRLWLDSGGAAGLDGYLISGDITLKGGLYEVTLNEQNSWKHEGKRLFEEGQRLDFHGAGTGEIAPFEGSVVAPDEAMLTSALGDFVVVDRAEPLRITWTGSFEGHMYLVAGLPGGSIQCAWPAADGEATVEPELLGMFSSGYGSLSLTTMAWEIITSAPWQFSLQVIQSVRAADSSSGYADAQVELR